MERNIIKYSFLIFILILNTGIYAQHKPQMPPDKHYMGINKKFYEAQLDAITKQINLPPEEEAKLRETYRNYFFEIEKARRFQMLNIRASISDTLSDTQAEKIMLDQIKSGRRFLDIRERYYFEFKKIITPKEIMKLYRIEQEINRKLMQEVDRRRE